MAVVAKEVVELPLFFMKSLQSRVGIIPTGGRRPLQNISILDSGGNPMTDVTLLHYNKPYLDRDWMKWRELTGVICGKL